MTGKSAAAAAIVALLATGQAGASETASLPLPAEAFKSAQFGAISDQPMQTVSIDLDLQSPRHKSVPPADELFGVQRLRHALTAELAGNFDLFLYVSKAARGPHAQRMYVVRKSGNGEFVLAHDWPVSTGRERVERNVLGVERYTVTPSGFYELDPERIFADYRSASWDEPMPHAMFFDAWYKGARVGLAIHAADENGVNDLGSRASAGCVRLSPDHARELFQLINGNYRGDVPRFAYDPATRSTRRDGALMRDADGKLEFRKGYRVLVIIEDAGEEQIATQ